MPKCDAATVYHEQRAFNDAVGIIYNGDFSEENAAKCKKFFPISLQKLTKIRSFFQSRAYPGIP